MKRKLLALIAAAIFALSLATPALATNAPQCVSKPNCVNSENNTNNNNNNNNTNNNNNNNNNQTNPPPP